MILLRLRIFMESWRMCSDFFPSHVVDVRRGEMRKKKLEGEKDG